MDPLEGSAPMRNPGKQDLESEIVKSCKGTSKQRGQGDCEENVFTSMSHETDLNFCPLNGPRPRNINSSTNNEFGQPSNPLPEGNSEQHSNNSPQMSNNTKNTANSPPDLVSNNKSDITPCDNGLESSQDKQTCMKHKVCLENVGPLHSFNLNAPSTSGASSSKVYENLPESSTFRESRKRPSSLKLNRSHFNAEDSSSDTGNDDYSLGSEDGCIYTYRGGEHLADLPSSFFSLDMGLPLDKHLPMPPHYPVAQQVGPIAREQSSRVSSPDMDFLEMDFDPGPSCEVDTGDESTPDTDLDSSNMPEEIEPVIRGTSPEYLPGPVQPQQIVVASTSAQVVEPHYCNVPSTSRGIEVEQNVPDNARAAHEFGPYITHINVRGEQFLVHRTTSQWSTTYQTIHVHASSGDLIAPREILHYEEEHAEEPFAYQINQGERPIFDSSNMSSTYYHVTMAKKLLTERLPSEMNNHDAPSVKNEKPETEFAVCSVEPPRCMVWSEREACERQVTQIGTSACGATAVVNVFIALGVPVNIERINSCVGTRQRANNAPLPRYLLTRAVAGCTAADLITGIQRASDGLVTARFFPTYPERVVSLSHWLADWISLGAVPIVTLNLQMGCEGEIPDAWHHQMVFGVSPQGVYLTNPVECVRESALWVRLTSPSVLLVRTRDVLARFTANTDLTPLMFVPDQRFHTFNVLGQVVNVIREWRATGWSEHGTRTRHVRVPAAYRAGVTVAALTGSEAHRRLVHAASLPLLAPDPDPDPHGESRSTTLHILD
ncbi:uncharacterized protein LOC126775078 isoform X1 [Nymphalis io]|uniref:uncharacterized protein LOC126775078 isoform X1 n=1 Tax=Inachis io TaxID=171585 RepID=UPI002166F77F|nr:uncharacterized protein LOC126775078 isoform X1 [Nymphalis io]